MTAWLDAKEYTDTLGLISVHCSIACLAGFLLSTAWTENYVYEYRTTVCIRPTA